ncbi:MAG: glycoside hydrolase family 2 TIM barrel-domain containing protein [Gemmatimonadaceae bacterium]
MCLLFLVAAPLVAQDEVGPAPKRAAGPILYAFTDTTSVRVDLTVPRAAEMNNVVANGKIYSLADESLLWSGEIGHLTVDAQGNAHLAGRVAGLKPKRWSPQSPSLYRLEVEAHGTTNLKTTARIGFRSVSAKNGQILLNGRPIFLKGNAINPPDRNIPDSLEENPKFIADYVKYLKSVGVNIIRLTRHSQAWFDVCDELGMMLFQGNYGTPKGAKATAAPSIPLAESMQWYRDDVLGPLANHPSVVVYVLSNEQADKEIGYLSTGADKVGAFLKTAYDSLHTWDASRVYITNAGYGFGRSGDLCDLHRYWGWYYNSFLSFYTMRYPSTCWRTAVAQPMTMTENTGNYTGVDGRFNLVSNTKQPDSQLNWTGHAPENEQSRRALAYQAWMGGQAIEIFRRSREQNPNLAGLTPFTILFHNWHGITKFDDMKPKPLGAQYGVSYQPVLLSWELWTPQVYAGATINPVAHVVNDDESGANLAGLTVRYALVDSAGKERTQAKVAFPDVKYYGAKSKPITIAVPANLPTGTYTLAGTLSNAGGVISSNTTKVFVAGSGYKRAAGPLTRQVKLYDPSGKSERALRALGVGPVRIQGIAGLNAERDLLVLGADSWDEALKRDVPAMQKFVSDGGRLLVLHQDFNSFDGAWLPVPIRLQKGELDHALVFPGGRPFRNGMSVNPEVPDHPVLSGIDRDRLFLWNDFTSWNETKPGFPQVYPVTRGFVVTEPQSMGRVGVLADYDHGLEGIALAELFGGKGSAMVTGFDLIDRSGSDPVADRMLGNLVRYMSSPEAHAPRQVANDRIVWGDYASERGVLTGVYSGLLVNTVPIVPADLVNVYKITVDKEGFWFAGGTSGWNTKPAIQYVAKGRRAYGPYTFTSGGSVQIEKGSTVGEGRVFLLAPANRSTMTTTFQNPVAEPINVEIGVNGVVQKVSIPGNQLLRVESPIAERELTVSFKGDRRVVILETSFK